MHNTLVASDYGLLDDKTLAPKPNYWGALLWRKLLWTTAHLLIPGAGGTVAPHLSHLTAAVNVSSGTTCLRPHLGHHLVSISSFVLANVSAIIQAKGFNALPSVSPRVASPHDLDRTSRARQQCRRDPAQARPVERAVQPV